MSNHPYSKTTKSGWVVTLTRHVKVLYGSVNCQALLACEDASNVHWVHTSQVYLEGASRPLTVCTFKMTSLGVKWARAWVDQYYAGQVA